MKAARLRAPAALALVSVLAALVAFAAGCARRQESAPASLAVEPAPALESRAALDAIGSAVPTSVSSVADADATALPARKRVRRVNLAMVVRDVPAAIASARALADSSGGFVADLDSGGETGVTRASLTLRIPAPRLDAALATLKRDAVRVTHEGSSLEDLTAQYVDVDARRRTLAATESELLALLTESRRRGAKTEDILAVYRELTGIRSQIEALQGQLAVIDRDVAYSTVSLTLMADAAARPLAIGPWRPGDTLRNSTRMLLVLLRGLGDLAIFVAVALLPVALVVGVPLTLLVRAWRRRRAARAAREPRA
jgi:hypothetical protein